MTDENTIRNDIDSPKPCFAVGKNIIVILDKRIVQELGINEEDTLVQQELTKEGILLRIRRHDQ